MSFPEAKSALCQGNSTECHQLKVPGVTSFTLQGGKHCKTGQSLRAVLERERSPTLTIIFPCSVVNGVLMLAVLAWLVMNWDVVLLGDV